MGGTTGPIIGPLGLLCVFTQPTFKKKKRSATAGPLLTGPPGKLPVLPMANPPLYTSKAQDMGTSEDFTVCHRRFNWSSYSHFVARCCRLLIYNFFEYFCQNQRGELGSDISRLVSYAELKVSLRYSILKVSLFNLVYVQSFVSNRLLKSSTLSQTAKSG